MCDIIDFNSKMKDNKIIGERYGSVLVSVYKTQNSNHSLFFIKPENEEVSRVADIIEEALKLY